MTTINAMRLASLVTAINVLVATGFSIAAIFRPEVVVPAGSIPTQASKLAASERWRPFFDERPRGLLMVFGAAGFDLMAGLEVEKLSKSPAFRGVKILLHQGKRDSRASRQLSGQQHGGFDKLGIRHDPIDHPECEGLRRIKRLSRVVEFARLARKPGRRDPTRTDV